MEWKYEKGRIFSVDENGGLISEITYNQKSTGVVNVNHVYVKPTLRGRGIAGKSMEVLVDYLRKENLKATATCSYANMWLRRNANKCSDIIADELVGEQMACSIEGKH